MGLNSLRFGLFFLIFLAVLAILPKRLRKTWLLAGNLVFYLSWERWACLLLLLSALMVWLCGLLLARSGSANGNKCGKAAFIFLILPVIWNISLLILFRQTGLISSIITRFQAGMMPLEAFAAPIGISFYTLRCISYIAEIWKGTLSSERNPLDVLIYVSFFPQIISGPIERPDCFFDELDAFSQRTRLQSGELRKGFLLYTWGLFQKLVLAERLAMISAPLFSNYEQFGSLAVLCSGLVFGVQLYCDFGGYSDMSRGAAGMMGFSTVRNFRQPYLAQGIKSFWRRWHISLTTWLTDYVYIPLGGSRRGQLRKYINILIVFLISGFWHGSTLNYVFWGLLHAGYEIIEDLWERTGQKLAGVLCRIITIMEVSFAWIFFNAGGLNRGFRIIRHIFSFTAGAASPTAGIVSGNLAVLGAGLIILTAVDLLHEKGISIHELISKTPLPLRWLLYLGLIWSVIMLGIYGVGYDTTGFIYAQF